MKVNIADGLEPAMYLDLNNELQAAVASMALPNIANFSIKYDSASGGGVSGGGEVAVRLHLPPDLNPKETITYPLVLFP